MIRERTKKEARGRKGLRKFELVDGSFQELGASKCFGGSQWSYYKALWSPERVGAPETPWRHVLLGVQSVNPMLKTSLVGSLKKSQTDGVKSNRKITGLDEDEKLAELISVLATRKDWKPLRWWTLARAQSVIRSLSWMSLPDKRLR